MISTRRIILSTMAEMEEKLVNCDASTISDSESQQLAECAAQVNLAKSGGPSYMPVGPADGGAAFSSDENIFGSLLAYPSVWIPSANAYENRSLKVAICLVAQGSLTIAAIMESMGCKNPTPGAAMTISKTMPTNETATSLKTALSTEAQRREKRRDHPHRRSR